MAKVSIIIPVYNSEKYLNGCVDSLLSQTHDDIEIILIDDCSKDNSYEIMRRIKDNNPRRVKIIKNKVNQGAGASRNTGLDIAEGKYIGFLDSDDYLDLDAIKKMHDSLEKTGVDIARINRSIVYKGRDVSFLGRKLDVSEDHIIVPSKELEYLTSDSPAVTNKMFNRKLIGSRRFPEKLKWEDYPFSIPLMYKANGVITVQDTEYKYNLNLTGTTVGDTFKISPKLLDIFTCSDLVRTELLNEGDEKLKERLDFLSIQNCLQRIRDVFYSNIPYERKKELISLISALINKKYGIWQENQLYQEYKKKKLLYRLRMDFTENVVIDESYNELDIPSLEASIQKVLKKNQ